VNKSAKCCTRQHLTLEEWGLLEDCTRLTCGGKNPFRLCGRMAAARFCQTGKNTIYRVVKLLEDKGWLVRISGGNRGKAGMYDPTVYKVISHEDWIKHEGRACPILGTGPVPELGQAPVPISSSTSPDLSRPPVLDSGHSSVRASVIDNTVKTKSTTETRSLSRPLTPTSQEQEQKQKLNAAIEQIGRLHPGNKTLRTDLALPKRLKAAIREAVRLDGEQKVLWGTAALALAVKRGFSFPAAPLKFYSEGQWRTDPREWGLFYGSAPIDRFLNELKQANPE
jgi:hypothetical protein